MPKEYSLYKESRQITQIGELFSFCLSYFGTHIFVAFVEYTNLKFVFQSFYKVFGHHIKKLYFSITNPFSFFLVGQMSLSILPNLSSLHFQVFVVKSKEKWSIKCYQIRAKIFLYLSSKFLSPSIFFDVINVKLDLEKKLEKRDIVSKMRKWIVGLGGLVQSTAVLPNQPFLFCVCLIARKGFQQEQ